MNAVSEIELVNIFVAVKRSLETDHYLIYRGGGGGGGVLPFLGLADNFFQRMMCFKQFFITFCNENNLFTTILKNVTGSFVDLI